MTGRPASANQKAQFRWLTGLQCFLLVSHQLMQAMARIPRVRRRSRGACSCRADPCLIRPWVGLFRKERHSGLRFVLLRCSLPPEKHQPPSPLLTTLSA
ncbi:hypothetical protein NDU88_002275 [Pleurodeles waltl]|uniref:Secreted protein n=1 Tax=Pleurodeles waltl TaxID=8319 RepID=A0AAV7UYF4_PLEWA|nr:hypothetical protein NDU88_002275 [Pleurodeles waltl]